MSNWFIVTSACNVDYGIFDRDQRYLQTVQTIESIKRFCPYSKIVLLEASPESLSQENKNNIKKFIDYFVDYSTDPLILQLHQQLSIPFLKSVSEAYIVGSFLQYQTFISSKDRIFKMSGRYCLNNLFKEEEHNKQGKYVFKQKQTAVQYFDPNSNKILETVSAFQYKTRLYSFCGSLIEYHSHICMQIFKFFYECFSKNHFTDIEHLMYKFLNHELVEEIHTLGIEGLMIDRREVFKE